MAEDSVATQILTFKFRLLPTKRQHAALARILEDQRQLYNAALEERIDCYRRTGKGLSWVDQYKSLTDWRRDDCDAAAVPSNIQRWTLKRLDDAYLAFFRRAKQRSVKAGFPRFRSCGRWRSFGFREFVGVQFDGRRLRFATLTGGIRVRIHRQMPDGKPLSCVFSKDGKGWSVCFNMRVPCSSKRAITRAVGLDLGLSSLAALSDGTSIPNPRRAKRAEKELRRRHRALTRCRRGSSRRRKVRAKLASAYGKITNARATHLHQISAYLVGRFDLIAIERLNVRGMASGMLAKPIQEASWATLTHMLAYKAEKAGALVIAVDPRNTSQACSGCGVIVKKALADRVHSCTDCGLVLDRDHNAAINILRKAVAGLEAHNVAQWSERAPGNIGKMCRDATLLLRGKELG